MRRGKMIAVLLAMGVVLSPCMLTAQLTVTVGGQYWYTMTDYQPPDVEDVDVEPTNTFGPYIRFRLGRFFVGTLMFLGTMDADYGSDPQFRDGTDFDYDGTGNLSFTGRRTDLHFSAGWHLFPGLGLFAVVRSLSYGYNGNFEDAGGVTTGSYDFETKGLLYGGGISGVFASPRRPFFLFWSAVYLNGVLDAQWTLTENDVDEVSATSDVDANITSLTLGLGYKTSPDLALRIGYRIDFSGEEMGEKKVHGVILTLAYTIK